MMYFHMFPPYAVPIVLQHVYRLWVRRDQICPVLVTQTGDLAGEIASLPFYITALCWSWAVSGGWGREHGACFCLTWGWDVHCCSATAERIHSDPKGLATVFPVVNTCQRVCGNEVFLWLGLFGH